MLLLCSLDANPVAREDERCAQERSMKEKEQEKERKKRGKDEGKGRKRGRGMDTGAKARGQKEGGTERRDANSS